MKKKLLQYLRCPYCENVFNLDSYCREGVEIIDGSLRCSCSTYPIIGGVPRILSHDFAGELAQRYHRFFIKYKDKLPKKILGKSSGHFMREKKKTAQGFGYEWKKFSKMQPGYEAQFLDWIYPLKNDFFQSKLVLDGGCGKGRHVFFAAKYGAEVIGIDLSEAVDLAFMNTRRFPHAHIVQADLYNLPFRNNLFDFSYSIGVLHHLPQPEQGFKAIVSKTKPQGSIFAWVYGREGNNLLKIMDPIRKNILLKFSLPLLEKMAWCIVLIIHPLTKLVYKPLNSFSLTRPLAHVLPQNSFFVYLSQFSFSVNHSILFDQFLAPIANYYSREEFEAWFNRAKVENIKISSRNNNSWRGYATKK